MSLSLVVITFTMFQSAYAKQPTAPLPECIEWFHKLGWDPTMAAVPVERSRSSHATGVASKQTTHVIAAASLGEKARANVAQTIREVNAFLGNRFTLPKQVIVNSVEEDGAALALKMGPICNLFTPRQFCTADGRLLTEVLSRPITEHEYGHAIYGSQLTAWAKSGTISLRYLKVATVQNERAKAVQLVILQMSLEKKLKLESDPAKIRRFNAALEDTKLKLSAFGRRHDELSATLEGIPPEMHTEYEELFADLLSISKRGDPQAISKALGENAPSIRDPSVVRHVDDWMRGAATGDEDPHHTLAPAISFVWNQYLKAGRSRKDRAAILQKVLLAIAKETDARMNDPQLYTLPVFVRNQRLIDQIKRTMSSPTSNL